MAARKAAGTENLASLASGALASDAKLREDTQRIFGQALKRADYILRVGSDAERASLIKAIVPQMMRSLQDEAADERAKQQRAAYDRMRAALRGDADLSAPRLLVVPPAEGGADDPLGVGEDE
jgi:hypothetical protein